MIKMLSGNNKKKYKISAVRTGVWTLRSRSCYSGVDSLWQGSYGIRKMCWEGVNTPPPFLFRKETRGTIFW